MDCQIAIAVDDGIGLVAVEDVDAAQVGSERAQTAEAEVFLKAKAADEAWLGDVEVVVLSLRGPFHIGTQAEVVRQFDGVSP